MPIKNLTKVSAALDCGGYGPVQDWLKFYYNPRKKQLEETIAAYKKAISEGKATSADRTYLKGDAGALFELEKQYKFYTKNGTRLTS
jgi:hypothetical protein